MDFRIRGISFPITPPDILKATRNVPPDPVDARNKYFVTLHEQPYPIKQVLRLVTGARVAPQLSRVRNDQVIARSPSTRRLLDDEHRGAGHRLACQVQKRRCLHGPVHPDFAQPLNSL